MTEETWTKGEVINQVLVGEDVFVEVFATRMGVASSRLEEVRDTIVNAAAELTAARTALRDVLAGGYYNECTCGHCVEIRRRALTASRNVETEEGTGGIR